jgi:hypothetical protein
LLLLLHLTALPALPAHPHLSCTLVTCVQLLDRSRHSAVIAALSGGEQSGLLSLLIHGAVASLTGREAVPVQYSQAFVEALLSMVGALVTSTSGACTFAVSPSGAGNGGLLVWFPVCGLQAKQTAPLVPLVLLTPTQPSTLSLHLLPDTAKTNDASIHPAPAPHATRAGTTALSDASLVPALLPLLQHRDPAHLALVSSTVRILEAFMDFR